MRIIDRETVHRLLPYATAIPLMRQAMIDLSAGRTRQLLRQILDLGGGDAFGVMPGASATAVGAKLITVFPGNFDKGLQSHQGGVMLFDPENGAPVALIHAGEITAIRTAAATAAATDALARPEASSLALLGYGEQALTHARALSHVRKLSHIAIWGRREAKARALADQLNAELGVPVDVAGSAAQAAQADIICAVTAASDPILLGADAPAGAHVNLVGSSRAGPREADDALVVRGRIFADHREGVLAQGAEIIHAMEAGLIGAEHVVGEIGQVFAGELAGRTAPDQVTVYKSLGAITQDLTAGWAIYQAALTEGAGVEAPF
jgi:ornithine cyclodeaminase/alanine dehydrogenase-like protein (mu-crystallin family)